MILRLMTGDFINTNCCLCCFSHCSLCSSIISGQWRHSLLPASAFKGTRHLQGSLSRSLLKVLSNREDSLRKSHPEKG